MVVLELHEELLLLLVAHAHLVSQRGVLELDLFVLLSVRVDQLVGVHQYLVSSVYPLVRVQVLAGQVLQAQVGVFGHQAVQDLSDGEQRFFDEGELVLENAGHAEGTATGLGACSARIFLSLPER